jgi:uncharacterized YceG family protein
VSPLFRRGGNEPQERTPEERARARAERAARRAERRGEPPPDLFDVEVAPPPPPEEEPVEVAEPAEPKPDPFDVEEAPEPEPEPEPEVEVEVEPEVEAEPELEPEPEPEAVTPPMPDPSPPAPPDPTPAPAPAPPMPDPVPPPPEPAPPPQPDPVPPPSIEAEPELEAEPQAEPEPAALEPEPEPERVAAEPEPEPLEPEPEPLEPEPEPLEPEPEPALDPDTSIAAGAAAAADEAWPDDPEPAPDEWPAEPATAADPWPVGEPHAYDSSEDGAIAPDDPLVGPRPMRHSEEAEAHEPQSQPHGQATAEIPLDELPDGGESFLAEDGAYEDGDHNLDGDYEPGEPPPPEPPLQRGEHGPPDRPRGRTWLLRIIAVLALLLVGVAIWFVVSLFQPFHGAASTKRATVFVPKGADAGKIGDILERRGLVSSSFFFDLRARLSGKRNDLKPGVYTLRQDSAYGDVLTALSKGPPPVPKVAITVPEGRSRAEEAARIRTNSNLQGSYLAATKRSHLLKPSTYGAPKGTPSLEGFLFPATYELKSNAPVKQLVNQQLVAFKRAIRRVPMAAARKRNLTPYDVLIIASMIEREAALSRERPLIAGVIYNRLKQNIPLGIDATIRYATGNWLRPLTQSQLAIKSPFNTRTHQGLPPTPIDSPGLAAIRAAAHPKHTPYLYYVVKPGGCGEHVFSKTFAQFQRDSARYNTARARNGGRSPTKCP